MKFTDLPKDAQHHALATLREMLTQGFREETELAIVGKVKTAFVSLYESEAKEDLLNEVAAEKIATLIASQILAREKAAAGEIITAVNLQGESVAKKTYASADELCEIAKSALRDIRFGMESYGITPSQNEIIRAISVARELIEI